MNGIAGSVALPLREHLDAGVNLRGHADGIFGDLSILVPNGRSGGLSVILR